MRKFLFFIILGLSSCSAGNDIDCLEEGCFILNSFSYSLSPKSMAIDVSYGQTSIVDGPGKTCIPDILEFYISPDNKVFSKVARVESGSGQLTIDELEDGKEYYVKMVNLHCELDSIVSPIKSVVVGAISSPQFIENSISASGFEDFRLAQDQDKFIYRDGSDNLYLSTFSNPQESEKVADDSFFAQWHQNDSEVLSFIKNIDIQILTNLNGSTSKFLIELDLRSQNQETIHDIETPHSFNNDTHIPEEYWIHEFHYSLDGTAIYFISNKDNGSSSIYEKSVFDNIWKLDLLSKEISVLSDFLPVEFDLEDFVEDPKRPGNFYVLGAYNNVEVDGVDIHYYDALSWTLTPILISDQTEQHISINPSGENLLFVSSVSGKSEVWSYNISNEDFKQITNSSTYSPSYRWHHLNWINDEQFMTSVRVEGVTKFAVFSIGE